MKISFYRPSMIKCYGKEIGARILIIDDSFPCCGQKYFVVAFQLMLIYRFDLRFGVIIGKMKPITNPLSQKSFDVLFRSGLRNDLISSLEETELKNI
jgi:hypothetical protein